MWFFKFLIDIVVVSVSLVHASYCLTLTFISREFDKAAAQYKGVGTLEVAPLDSSAFFGLATNERGATRSAAVWPQYIYADPRVSQLVPEDGEWRNEWFNYDYSANLETDKLKYQPLTQEQIDAISALPQITSSDTRYMTAGFSDRYYRLDEDIQGFTIMDDVGFAKNYYYDYSARAIVEATLVDIRYDNPYGGGTTTGFNHMFLEDAKLLGGKVQWMEPRMYEPSTRRGELLEYDNGSIVIHAYRTDPDVPIGMGVDSGRIVWVGMPGYAYDTKFLQGLELGGRYVFVLRYEPLISSFIAVLFAGRGFDLDTVSMWEKIPNELKTRLAMALYDYMTEQWCPAVWPLDGEPADYLESDKYAPLRELIKITDADIQTFDMVYTEDMGTIMRFQTGDMAITEGRALTPEDTADSAAVCVVSSRFAEENGLIVGDSITMKLGTELFEQFKGLGAVAVTPERYRPSERDAVLEIVGIYTDTDTLSRQSEKPQWCYSVNTVFIPKSLLNADEESLAGHEFTPAEFGFTVEDAWDIREFRDEAATVAEELGLTLIFDDGGWSDISQGFYSTKQASIIRVAVSFLAVIAAMGISVYLHIGRKKKDYAVMRSLGATKRSADAALMLPLMLVAAISVIAGSAVGLFYANASITARVTALELGEISAEIAMPAWASLCCIIGPIILVAAAALLILRRIGGSSALKLLNSE